MEEEEDPVQKVKVEIFEDQILSSALVVKKEAADGLIDDFDEDEEDEPYNEDDLDDSSDFDISDNNSDFEFKSSSNDLARDDSNSEVTCDGCQKGFRSQANLNKHLGKFAPCKKVYEESGSLPACFTKKTEASSAELEYECQKCKKGFASEGSLNRHVAKIKPCKRYYDKLNGDDVFKEEDGLTPRQSYYKRNRERVIQRQKEYYRRNADRVKEKRIQHYKTRVVASFLTEEGGLDFGLQKGGAPGCYMERHKEYYEKNKEVIKERRRNYYHTKKEALLKKVGRHEFAKISGAKNLAEIPDPFEPYGVVKVDIPPQLPPIKALKRKRGVKNDLDEDEEADFEEAEKNASSTTSPLNNCFGYGVAAKPGASKIKFNTLGDNNELDDLLTMPEGARLSAKPFEYAYVQNVESFVGLTLSEDGESLELCQLLHRKNITLEAIQKLIHGILSVLSIDMKTFIQERTCPVNLFEIRHMHLLKDRLTRDLMAANNVLPEATAPICTPVASTETDFLDEAMSREIPHDQLLINQDLLASDLGAVGVQWRLPDDPKQVRINPLFSINSMDHWKLRMRHFYTLLVNWVGGKVALNQIFHLLPCMISAKEAFFDEVRLECHAELLKPMETKICEHCGEVFQFSKYTLQTRRAYARHVQLHDHNCKICGENFPNGTQRKFHERSHKEHSVKCPHENCHYVGSSQQAVDTHIKHAHSNLVCDLCGKVTVAQNLKLHMATHHAPKTFEFICAVCGKGYSTKNILDKHLKRHNNPDSLINKWMTEPNEFKFECKEHDNCKKFFKSEKRLKEHLKKYGGKAYPSNLARQYVPNLPENHCSIVDSTNIQIDKPINATSKKLASKKEQNPGDNRPCKKRSNKPSTEDKLKELLLSRNANSSGENGKNEPSGANMISSTAAVSPSGSNDSYQPPNHLDEVRQQSLYQAQLLQQHQQLVQGQHDLIHEHLYGSIDHRAQQLAFRHHFAEMHSSSTPSSSNPGQQQQQQNSANF